MSHRLHWWKLYTTRVTTVQAADPQSCMPHGHLPPPPSLYCTVWTPAPTSSSLDMGFPDTTRCAALLHPDPMDTEAGEGRRSLKTLAAAAWVMERAAARWEPRGYKLTPCRLPAEQPCFIIYKSPDQKGPHQQHPFGIKLCLNWYTVHLTSPPFFMENV